MLKQKLFKKKIQFGNPAALSRVKSNYQRPLCSSFILPGNHSHGKNVSLPHYCNLVGFNSHLLNYITFPRLHFPYVIANEQVTSLHIFLTLAEIIFLFYKMWVLSVVQLSKPTLKRPCGLPFISIIMFLFHYMCIYHILHLLFTCKILLLLTCKGFAAGCHHLECNIST